METIDKRTFKEKWEDLKGRMALKWQHFKEWWAQNWEPALTVIFMVLPFVAKAIKETNKMRSLNAEQRRRNREIYDPRKGRYYVLKRTPKQWEWEEIDYRYESGENYSSILRDMNLI